MSHEINKHVIHDNVYRQQCEKNVAWREFQFLELNLPALYII